MRKMDDVIGVILAGGYGSRLLPLTSHRSKPGVFFAGSLRLIDFPMNNFLNSGIKTIIALTQFRVQSVKDHIDALYPSVLSYGYSIKSIPAQQKDGENWYRGTADAVFQNMDEIEGKGKDTAAIFASDHVYMLNVSQMMDFHKNKKSDFTICVTPCLCEKAVGEFGVIEVDENGRVIGFQEKPETLEEIKEIPGMPGMCFASTGNYLAQIKCLSSTLSEDSQNSESKHDFGKDVIPLMFEKSIEMFAYNLADNVIAGQDENHWADVGKILDLWNANMDACSIKPKINLRNTKNWRMRLLDTHLPDVKIGLRPQLDNVIVSRGCTINGCSINNSVLSPNVFVEKYARIEGGIIFPNCTINKGAKIRNTIIDSGVLVPRDYILDPDNPPKNNSIELINGILVVPKGCVLT